MNGWYQTKDARTGVDVVINLDAVVTIFNDHGKAAFVMNTGRDNSHFNSFISVEKYSDVIRKIFELGEPEEGEDDGKPGDPSGFNGVLPM